MKKIFSLLTILSVLFAGIVFGKVLLVSPASNSVMTNCTPTLVWTSQTNNITNYKVYLDGVKVATKLSTKSTNLTVTVGNGTHSWFVKSSNLDGRTNTTSIWTFRNTLYLTIQSNLIFDYPSVSATPLLMVPYHAPLTVLGSFGDWTRVTNTAKVNRSGWVKSTMLRSTYSNYGVVEDRGCPIFSTPNGTWPIWFLNTGVQVKKLSANHVWDRVRTSTGKTGWIWVGSFSNNQPRPRPYIYDKYFNVYPRVSSYTN